jgi:hypothetical protein
MMQYIEGLPVSFWHEEELDSRDQIIQHITKEMRHLISGLHPSMQIRRIEYPTLVPFSSLRDRPQEAFRLGDELALSTGEGEGGCVSFLRHAMKSWTPQSFPLSYQHLGKNFRTENPRYTGPFRSWEFWQLDWDCYWIAGQIRFEPEMSQCFSEILRPIVGETMMRPEPEQTAGGEWKMNFDILSDITNPPVEVAGYSTRSQQPPFLEWDGPALQGFNVSFGIDRLVIANKIWKQKGLS